ncbi:hypothetical protein KR009_003821 [Drosophila setifemur]|nr:hypothetical protein KR009_003821 [Drosophila setifemur]
MAFYGHVNPSGQLDIRKEVYSSKTRLRRSSSLSDNAPLQSSQETRPHSQYKSEVFNKTRNSSLNSKDSWSVIYEVIKESQGQSNFVPPLHLISQTSSLSYLNHIDGMKMDREPEAAYKNWYSAKNRQRQKQHQLLTQERDHEQQRVKERKELAKQCYDQWLRDKAQRAEVQRVESHLQNSVLTASLELTKRTLVLSPTSGSVSFPSNPTKSIRNMSQHEIRKVVEGWWLKKMQLQQSQREKKLRDMHSKAIEEGQRKRLAQAAWQKWMSNVSEKPKPVPLNQGVDSLRGTISQLYVNPKPWLGPIKPLKK